MQDLLKKLLFGNAGGSNGGAPSLNLSFVDGGTFSPRITFSRGTNATLTDSNGLIAWAPHNLLTNSEDFEAAAWVKTSATIASNNAVAPDGTTTADTFTAAAANAVIGQAWVSTTAPYTFSIWMRRVSGSGTIEINGGASWSTATITSDWQRISVTQNVTAGVPSVGVRIVTSGDVIQVWGAQLNVGSTAQSYNSTTPKNLLGFTQEPENAAWTKSNSYVQQNLLTWSQGFENSAWQKLPSGVAGTPVVTADVGTAPDGTVTADRVQLTLNGGTTSGDRALVAQSVTLVVSTTYTYSIWLRSRGASVSIGIGVDNVVGNTPITVTSSWQRFTVTGTATGTSGLAWFQLRGAQTPVQSDSADLEVWGAQLVQGTDAGQYTQTTSAAAVTRYMAWDGTLTGRKLVEDTANAFHGVNVLSTLVSGVRYTQSVYAKAGERQWMMMAEGNNVTASAWFNLSTGVVGTVSGTGTPTATITNVGGGWYRCSLSYTPIANAGNTQARATTGDNVSNYTGDGTSGIYVTDFQLSNSASVDPYVYNPQAAAASAAFYGPRIDYDPVTLASRGLLIEEQRTNLLTYSEQFDNVAWVKVGSTVTANATAAPDGATAADKLVEDTSTGVHVTTQNVNLTAGVSYTFSAFVKAAERTRLWFERSNATLTAFTALVDFSTGTVVSSTGSVTASVTPAGNGFYRVFLTVLAASTASGGVQVDLVSTGSTINYTGDGTSGIFIWGAQLEAGSFATSYIPTVASQVTRNADSASMLGDNFYTWYNPNQGTLSAEATAYNANAVLSNLWVPTVAAVLSNTSNYFSIGRDTGAGQNKPFGNVVNGGVTQATLQNNTVWLGNTVKQALAVKANDFAYNDSTSATTLTDTSGSIPAVTSMSIGSRSSDGWWNGTIRSIRYYTVRLPDATLQQITS